MGHSIGISDSYYRITEDELQKDYLKAIDYLTIDPDKTLLQKIEEQNKNNSSEIQDKLKQKDFELKQVKQQEIINRDAIAMLSDQLSTIMQEFERLKGNTVNPSL